MPLINTILASSIERPIWLNMIQFNAYLAIVISIVTLYAIIRYVKWKRDTLDFKRFASDRACCPAPTITSSFYTGILHKWVRLRQRGDLFNDYMRKVFLAHGPTHAIAKPYTGEIKAIYTIEPENVKAMLSTNFADYHRPRTMPNALNPVMGQGVFTSNGHAWQHSRGLVRAQFSVKRIRNVNKLESHVQNIFEALGKAADGIGWTEEQEILPIFNRFTLDAATEFMFGTSAESHEAFMRERGKRDAMEGTRRSTDFWARQRLVMSDFGTAFDIALDYVALRLKLGRLWYLADGIRFRLACHKVKSFADKYIREATAHAANHAKRSTIGKDTMLDTESAVDDRRYGLISELVESYPDKIALRNQVMQLLVAGRDTTAATLAWTFILLESHPEIFTRLRAAIVAKFGTECDPSEPVTFDSLRACKYLQWTIFEAVRLYPTGPLNARKATVNTVLPVGGGPEAKHPVAVKAGTIVAYNTYLMHRREEFWGEDAWTFRPERWEGRKTGWEYIPFHGGPQTCLGQQHALTEMAYVITCMLQRFDTIKSSTRATNFENGIRTILVPKRAVMLQFRSSQH